MSIQDQQQIFASFVQQLIDQNLSNTIQFEIDTVPDFVPAQQFSIFDSFVNQCILPGSQFKDKDLQFIGANSRHMVCGANILNMSSVKCYTCSTDPCSVLCQNCFEPEKHIGHNYKIISGQGLCDCGFAQTINPSGFCSKHEGNHIQHDLFKQNEKDFDLPKLGAFLLSIFQIYTAFVTKIFQTEDEMQKRLLQQNLFKFHHLMNYIFKQQIDLFKKIIANIMIVHKQNMKIEDLLVLDIEQFIHVYIDAEKILNQFLNGNKLLLMNEVPVGLFMMLQKNIQYKKKILNPAMDLMYRYLIDSLVAEPGYRKFVGNTYYLKNTIMLEQNFLPFIYNVENRNVFKQTCVLTPIDVSILEQISGKQDPWYEISVQSHNCLKVNDETLFISTITEQISSFVLFTRFLQGRQQVIYSIFQQKIDKIYQDIESKAIDQCLQFQSYKSKDQKDEEIKQIIQLSKIFDNALQTRSYLYIDLQNLQKLEQMFKQFSGLFNKVTSLNWSMKTSQFSKKLIQQQYPMFVIASNLSIIGKMYITRRKQRDCINYDEQYNQILFSYLAGPKIYFQKFLDAIYGQAFIQDEIIEVSRVCQKLDTFKSNIDLSSLLYTVLVLEINQSNFVINGYNMNNDYWQIHEGFGIHTMCPTHDEEEEFNHLFMNDSLQLINVLMRLIPQDKQKEVFFMISSQLKIKIENIISFLVLQCVQVLVTKSMCDAKMLERNGKNFFLVSQFYYNHKKDRTFNIISGLYELIQRLYAFNLLDENRFQQMVAEAFGFYDLEIEAFQFVDNEDPDRKLKMLGDYIKLMISIQLCDQKITSPHDYMTKQVLAMLIEYPKEPVSTLHIGFTNSEFYNFDYLEQILQNISSLTKSDIQQQELYTTDLLPDHYKINNEGLKLINPNSGFFTDIPGFVMEYQNIFENKSCMQLEADLLIKKEPFSKQFFSEDNVIFVSTLSFLEEFFMNNYDKSLISQNELVAVLQSAFQFRNNIQIKQIFQKIQTKISSKEIVVGDFILKMMNNLFSDIKTQKVDQKERLQKLKLKQKQGDTQLMNMEEHQDLDDQPLNQEVIESLQIFESVGAKCSICSMIDSSQPLSINAFIQPSSLLCQKNDVLTSQLIIPTSVYNRQGQQYSPEIKTVQEQVYSFDSTIQLQDLNYQPIYSVGTQINSCSHFCHSSCMQKMNVQKVSKCPLCRSITNCQIPLAEGTSKIKMLEQIQKLTTELYQICLFKQSVVITDNRYNFSTLQDVLLFINEDELQLTKHQKTIYQQENQTDLVFLRNKVVQAILILIDSAYSNILIQKQQYIKEESPQFLNALKASAGLLFCAKWLFNLCCSGKRPLFIADVEENKFLSLFTNNFEAKNVSLFRYATLFKNQFYKHENYLSLVINLKNSIHLSTNSLQEQFDKLQFSKYKNYLNELDDEFDLQMLVQLKNFYQILNNDQKFTNSTLELKDPNISICKKTIMQHLPPNTLMLSQEPNCTNCKAPIVLCLFCQKKLCPRCTNLIQHSSNCGLQAAFFCFRKNLIFVFTNKNHCYVQAGPYLSQNNESDILLLKQLNCELQLDLVKQLDNYVFFGRYFKIDIDSQVVIPFERVVTILLTEK